MWVPGYGESLVPDETRIGDVVCVLLGAATPFVLRPRAKHFVVCGPTGQQYQIVGDCWVPGVMHGELSELALERENVHDGHGGANARHVIRDITIV